MRKWWFRNVPAKVGVLVVAVAMALAFYGIVQWQDDGSQASAATPSPAASATTAPASAGSASTSGQAAPTRVATHAPTRVPTPVQRVRRSRGS